MSRPVAFRRSIRKERAEKRSGPTVEARDAAVGRLGATRRAALSGRQGASSRLPDAPHRAAALLPCRPDSTAQTMTLVKIRANGTDGRRAPCAWLARTGAGNQAREPRRRERTRAPMRYARNRDAPQASRRRRKRRKRKEERYAGRRRFGEAHGKGRDAAAKHDIASLVSGEVFEQIQLVIDSADMVLGFG